MARTRKNSIPWIILGLVILGILAVLGVILALVITPFSPTIGIIEIHGEITSESSNNIFSHTVGSRDIVDEIKEAEDDPSIKVIFLDINSPGGSVVASKEIAYAVENCTKPVVAYIGDIGASGAYYVASASDLVIADEDSLTGSIGVIMELENYAGLLKKLGINITTLKEGKYKDIGSPTRPLTLEERKILENITNLAYQHFKRDLLAFRGDKLKASIDQIADGRPLTGYQAWRLGLVDELGTREFALKEAWKLAGQKGEPRTKIIKKEKFSLSSLLEELGHSFAIGMKSALEETSIKIQA